MQPTATSCTETLNKVDICRNVSCVLSRIWDTWWSCCLKKSSVRFSSLFCYVMWVAHNFRWMYYIQRRHLENRVSQCILFAKSIVLQWYNIQIIELLSTWPLMQIARELCYVLQINNFTKLTTHTVALKSHIPCWYHYYMRYVSIYKYCTICAFPEP